MNKNQPGQNWSGSISSFQNFFLDTVAANLTPPPKLTVSEWADANRMLSAEAAAEPGPWATSRTEYMRGIMDAISDPQIHTGVIMSSAQVGKTECILNISGYYIQHDPAPMLVVQPTKDFAETFSKDRLAPMIRDTPVLTSRVQDGRVTKGTASTVLHKVFPGGHLTMVGANEPADLAGRPIRIALMDEVDRYPHSAGREGDPVSLVRKRTKTFWNRKTILVSSPTIKGLSRIETAYEASDKRQYWVPCHNCGQYQVLIWGQVKWGESVKDAHYECEHCKTHWSDVQRYNAVSKGEWIAQEVTNGVAGFHLNALVSPWTILAEMAAEFLEAKKTPETLQTFINTELGETFEIKGDRIDDNILDERKETAWDKVPALVVLVTAGIDVQDDRLEVEFVGWGPDEESWSLEYVVLYGDPSTKKLWADLDNLLKKKFEHETLKPLSVAAACVDTGGHYTNEAYLFCRPLQGRNIWAIKGDNTLKKKPIWPTTASTNNKAKVPLYIVGVNAAKEQIHSRIKIDTPGPGYCHFPDDRFDEYFRQFVAEEGLRVYHKGFPHIEWRLRPGHRRNEAFDCRVYATAALNGLIMRGLRLNHYASRKGISARAAATGPSKDSGQAVASENKPAIPSPPRKKKSRRRRGGRSSIM